MAWLINSFGFDILINKPSLVADQAYIPVTYTANLESAQKMAAVVAAQMDVDPALIQLHLYQEGQRQIGNDGLSRFSIIMQAAENQTYSGGKYFGADENGNYQIGIKYQNLQDPEAVLGLLAHEIAHIKLLGEKRTAENNEPLTDLTSLFFGLGAINANLAFKHAGGINYYSLSKTGYLEQAEWGYALALRSFLIGEQYPDWTYHLNSTIKSDYKKCLQFFIDSEFSLDEYKPVEPPIHPRFVSTLNTEQDELAAEYQKAIELYDQKQFDQASDLFYKVVIKKPLYKRAFICGLYALLQAKSYSRVIELVELKEKEEELTGEEAPYAGQAYLKLGNFENAFKYFQRSIDENPFDVLALNNAGFCLNRLEKFEDAIPYFDEVIEYEPSFAFAFNNRGLAKVKCGQSSDGLKDIRHSLQLMPDNAYSYRNLGVYYLDTHDNKSALESLNKAKQLDPNVDEIDALIKAAQA